MQSVYQCKRLLKNTVHIKVAGWRISINVIIADFNYNAHLSQYWCFDINASTRTKCSSKRHLIWTIETRLKFTSLPTRTMFVCISFKSLLSSLSTDYLRWGEGWNQVICKKGPAFCGWLPVVSFDKFSVWLWGDYALFEK